MIGCPSNRPPPEDKIPAQRTPEEQVQDDAESARAAKHSAADELDKVESRWPEVLQRTAFLRLQRQENHFAERLRSAFTISRESGTT